MYKGNFPDGLKWEARWTNNFENRFSEVADGEELSWTRYIISQGSISPYPTKAWAVGISQTYHPPHYLGRTSTVYSCSLQRSLKTSFPTKEMEFCYSSFQYLSGHLGYKISPNIVQPVHACLFSLPRLTPYTQVLVISMHQLSFYGNYCNFLD